MQQKKNVQQNTVGLEQQIYTSQENFTHQWLRWLSHLEGLPILHLRTLSLDRLSVVTKQNIKYFKCSKSKTLRARKLKYSQPDWGGLIFWDTP